MIPRLTSIDSSLALLAEGYVFASRRCDRLGSDAFRTRVLGVPVTFLRGPEGSRLFYDPDRFTRRRAIPPSVQHLLQDAGSVQSLDGAAHHHRKAMFLDVLMAPEAAGIADIFAQEWQRAVQLWSRRGQIALQDELEVVLTRTALRFAGIGMGHADVRTRARELAAMVNKAATVGPPNWWARALRRRTERWARQLIARTRAGALPPSPHTALAALASHRDPDGRLLDESVAAVELINILRPIVAVSRFITFAAVALIQHPQWHRVFATGAEDDLTGFVQEVRRFYPFFPSVPGRARASFAWHGHRFDPGSWVMLDLYATNHDPAVWKHPEAFSPERFRHGPGDSHTLIPQGGGDVATGHRCPGEQITIALMKEAVRQLTRHTRYEVPAQDLSIPLNKFPALPREGVLLRHVAAVD